MQSAVVVILELHEVVKGYVYISSRLCWDPQERLLKQTSQVPKNFPQMTFSESWDFAQGLYDPIKVGRNY